MEVGEKLSLKHSLVMAGFWEDEEKDPATDEKATAELLQKIEEKLGQGAYLFFSPITEASAKHEVRVNWDHMTSVLARDEELSVALCLAALELPNFLTRHPECAAIGETDTVERDFDDF